MSSSITIRLFGENIRAERPLAGGSIHRTSRIETESGRAYVLKKSNLGSYFHAEADGLRALAGTKSILVPDVIDVSDNHLLIEWLEPANPDRTFYEDFGRALAAMHRTTRDHFGYDRENFIGRLPQDNTPEPDLATFFARRRFLPLAHQIGGDFLPLVEKLCKNLPSIFEPINEKPALLHGDLWSGNFVATQGGAALIDPAVYFGPREADIAMTKLFGEFPPEFYSAYEEAYPLPEGWRDRVSLFNLYHLMTHAIMFGGSYESQARTVIDHYTR